MPLTLEQRRENYAKVSEKLAQMNDDEIAELLKKSEQVHKGIGGTAVALEVEGVPIFAKRISLTDRELTNPYSTKNLFDLPTYYQYGIGSAGFGAWRELAAHQMASDWVRNGECPNFPLLYGHRVVDKPAGRTPNLEDEEFLDSDQKYWGESPQVRARLDEIEKSTHSVVVFLESIPQNLNKYLREENPQNRRDVEMVERDIRRTTAFMESKGMIHFDAHRWNLLTDGKQVYFSDFGLATSREFELSDAEREFFEKNHGYDLALGFNYLAIPSAAPEVKALAEKHQGLPFLLSCRL